MLTCFGYETAAVLICKQSHAWLLVLPMEILKAIFSAGHFGETTRCC
jgi:hypothetical protein